LRERDPPYRWSTPNETKGNFENHTHDDPLQNRQVR